MPSASGRRQPDYALFTSEAHRQAASGREGVARFRDSVAVCDAKRFGRPLDGRRKEGALSEDPVAQIIHYVAITRTRWGLLTNGRTWRLYAAEGDMVEGACFEIDLVAAIEAEDAVALRYFAVLFGASSFEAGADNRALVDRALDGSRAHAVDIGDGLRRQVFAAVPLIAEGLLGDDERTHTALSAAFDNSLVVLYRVLFCLHAEDRGLLPVGNVHYRSYSLQSQRRRLAVDRAGGRIYSSRSDDLWNDLRALFRIVDQGDSALGVNEYDGGLFAADRHPWLQARVVPDDRLSVALDLLYRVGTEQVDFRDLSVRHLGTIFEQLLAFELADAGDGPLSLAPAGGRKATGAYFTPEHIVDEIVERTLGPLFDARSSLVRASGLSGGAALEGLLDLHVLDPAMGSGHFLVGAAAYLARRIATDPTYDGAATLTELRGLVAERCLYGVDLNPMAVEVARLALWLSTVRADRPLRFLGNLRVGNALVGAELSPLLDGGPTLFADELAGRAQRMLDALAAITAIDARSGAEAHEQQALQADLERIRGPLLVECDAAIAPPVGAGAGRPFHWEIEFCDRFIRPDGSIRSDPGFDAVIGNPPYVRIQELGRDVAAYCKERYATAFGSFDVYVPFLERGLELLRSGGRLGFIVPTAWIRLDYGRRLRALLARRRLVEEIVDFGHAQVFASATNYTCMLVLQDGGTEHLDFTAVTGATADVRRAVASHRLPQAERYANADLDDDPWLLVPPDERRVIDAMRAQRPRLDEVVGGVFTGLQTNADAVYIVELVERRGGAVVVRTKEGETVELESELLHPLASGSDVERYALRALNSLLLFPYRRRADGQMALLDEDELRALPRIWEYLTGHKAELRSRERGKMDGDGWWAYVYPKSLGLHDRPKLGVAATVQRLEVAADLAGEAFFHNVRVNGILAREGGPSLPALAALLNSRPVDFAFRRRAAPLQNGFFTANKQFISWLPVPDPLPSELHDVGLDLHGAVVEAEQEIAGTLRWLGSVLETRLRSLRGWTTVERFADHGAQAVLHVLDANAARLPVDPRNRAVRDRIVAELPLSAQRVHDARSRQATLETRAEAMVADAFGLDAVARARIDRDYPSG